MKVNTIKSISIRLASPKEILSWSHGEVLKAETINYRTLKPEKDGLFCEKIFGPTKDYCCYCGKYRGIRYKGIICDRCGVEVAASSVRRERMGHINLATPVSHIWFLRGVPSRIGMVLGISKTKLERIIYFISYIIISVSEDSKQKILEEIESEYNIKVKSEKSNIKNQKKLNIALKNLKEIKEKVIKELKEIEVFNVLSEEKYRDFSLKYGEIFEAKTGAQAIYKIFEKVDLKSKIEEIEEELKEVSTIERKKALRRLKFFQGMLRANIRPEWMFVTVLPVLPPDLRPMVQLDGGRYASSDLNDLYRRVINRNNRLKYLLEISAPEVIIRNEKRMLQEAVDALIDNQMRTGTVTKASTGGSRLLKSLADMLKGKKGRFRRNLLGKRVDYSGRGVIVVGPELSIDKVGLPKEMALEIFKPFVIKELLGEELAYNVKGALRLIEAQTDEVWSSLERVVENKVVLLNRAPTLHRISIQAFRPILIEGKAIEICPLVCSAFNADFDGDQMAVHLPLSSKAQKESREIMLSSLNLLKPANGRPIVSLNQDVILGSYWMSKIKKGVKGEGQIFPSSEEAILAYDLGYLDLRAEIQVKDVSNKNINNINQPSKADKPGKSYLFTTSVGRIIFNQALPDDFPFQNQVFTSNELKNISRKVTEMYDNDKSAEVVNNIKNVGFKYSTISGLSIGADDFIVPPEKKEIVEKADKEVAKINSLYQKGLLSREEKKAKVIEVWTLVKSKIREILPKTLPEYGTVFTVADSGCRGSWSQPLQIAGMRGLMVSPSGEIIELPVKRSFKEGLGVLEYFISTHGARKGTSDKALGTSKAGYLTRRLVDVAHDIIVEEEDCGDTDGLKIDLKDAYDINQDITLKIVGRITLEDIKDKNNKLIVKKGDMIDWLMAEKIGQNKVEYVRVRSPLTCKNIKGTCQKCYGWDLGHNNLVKKGEAVGVVAAQSIGEPGTQLTMRTFHTGGVAGDIDITLGLPRIEEIFESRPPKGEGIISKTDGNVLEVKDRVVKIQTASFSGNGKKNSKKPKNKKDEIFEYKILGHSKCLVKKGDKVEAGQQLSQGNINLKKLFRFGGKEKAQRYILSSIQNVYVSQGVKIHDKHIEIIVRQMFSRVRIVESGDSRFAPGEVIEKYVFILENQKLKKENKKLSKAKEILLGISRVSLTSESVLSAASFQQTSKILIKASLEGKEDKILGLKESVIIGKLIPAGTGFKHKT